MTTHNPHRSLPNCPTTPTRYASSVNIQSPEFPILCRRRNTPGRCSPTVSSVVVPMADLAASIVGLVGFAAQVSKLLYGYYGEAKNAPEDIKQLASEISTLAGLLEPLSKAAEASRISQTPDSEWMSQLVHEFTKILEELKSELPCQISEQSGGKTRKVMRSFIARLAWPFKREDIQKQIQKVERLKTTVTVKLQLWVTHIFCL